MKRFAALLVSVRTWTLTDVLWRVSVLFLPWQTRWFLEAPHMGGFAWEQGRTSIYASSLVMLLFTALVAWRERATIHVSWKRVALMVGFLVVFLIPTLSWRASGQWLSQVLVLSGWVWAMVRARLRYEVFLGWLLLGLLPSVLFGLGQILWQVVPASTLLGVAAQDPLVRGVSVIQMGAERFLRAYGSFPHPNIFGGWMALGLLLLSERALSGGAKKSLYWLALPLFTAVLYGSFSRAAWIAAAVGVAAQLVLSWSRASWRRALGIATIIVAAVALGIILRPELVFTRLQATQRLEVKSLNERQEALWQSVGVLSVNVFGTGLGAYRPALANYCQTSPCAVPAEPPHLAFVLALVELGLFRGVLLLLFVGMAARQHAYGRWSSIKAVFPVILLLAVLALFDHYLWSLWAGQALVATAFAVAALRQNSAEQR